MKFLFIGWCRVGVSDKVWAVMELPVYTDNKYTKIYLRCWGRRGKKLQTLREESEYYTIMETAQAKVRKGYTSIDQEKLDQVYPEFESDLKKTAVWATLSAK